jgi:hypothetical protein
LDGGYYTLREAFTGGVSIATGNEFTSMETAEFEVDWVSTGDKFAFNEGIRIYPNPLEAGTTLFVTLEEGQTVSYIIYDGLGQVIYRQSPCTLGAGEHRFPLRRDDLPTGINFVQVKIGDKTYSAKMLVNH